MTINFNDPFIGVVIMYTGVIITALVILRKELLRKK